MKHLITYSLKLLMHLCWLGAVSLASYHLTVSTQPVSTWVICWLIGSVGCMGIDIYFDRKQGLL